MLNDDDFEAIGIPSAGKGCNIVLTSRNEDECNKMGSQCNFRVGVLEGGEAWDLFRGKAGKCIEDPNIHKTARNIVAECGGLPIAIVTIATSLKDKPQGIWNDSLLKLRNSNLSGILDMEKVYSRIELSYDLLNDKEAQSCLLLCCLYPEDYNIHIEDLVLYGKSLDFFESVDTMKEARDRVELILHRLKTSFLLHDGDEYECVKMHDLVRDFAVAMSSKTVPKYKNWSSLKGAGENIFDLKYQNLEVLQLASWGYSNQFQDDICDAMKNLKVLSLNLHSLLDSLTVPKKLRALFVREVPSDWRQVRFRNLPQSIGDLIGDRLMNVEILSFVTGRPCREFPMEIGLMCNLRFLRIRGVSLQHIPPGVLRKMVKLEELYLPWSFMDWGREGCYIKKINASLDELEYLPLTALEIGVRKGSVLGEKLVKELIRFQVFVGGTADPREHIEKSKALLQVHGFDFSDITESWFSALSRKSEVLCFISVENLKNITCLRLENNGFEQLKKIYMSECYGIECLVDRADEQIPWGSTRSFSQLETLKLMRSFNLKDICRIGPNFSKIEAQLLFGNLIRISISHCANLKSVFPLSVARGLSQLQRMNIRQCHGTETIIHTDELDDDNQLQVSMSTELQNAAPDFSTPTSKTVHVKFQLKKECMFGDEILLVGNHPILGLWNPDNALHMNWSDGHIWSIDLDVPIETTMQFKFILKQSLGEIFWQPGPNRIFEGSKCKAILITAEDWENPEAQTISEEQEMVLTGDISNESQKVDIKEGEIAQLIPTPETTTALNPTVNHDKAKLVCPTPNSIIRDLLGRGKQPKSVPNEQQMKENSANRDEKEVDVVMDAIIFPRLNVLKLGSMPNLKVFYDGNHPIQLPSLGSLRIYECDKMEAFSSGPCNTPILKQVQINKISHQVGEDVNAFMKETVHSFSLNFT